MISLATAKKPIWILMAQEKKTLPVPSTATLSLVAATVVK